MLQDYFFQLGVGGGGVVLLTPDAFNFSIRFIYLLYQNDYFIAFLPNSSLNLVLALETDTY